MKSSVPDIDIALGEIGAGLLENLDDLRDRIVAWAPELGVYGTVPPEELRRMHEAFLRRVVGLIFLERKPPSPEDAGWMDAGIEARLHSGVELDEFLTGVQVAHREMWKTFSDVVERRDDGRVLLRELGSLLLDWTNAFAARGTAVYRRVERETGRLDQLQRERFLHDLLTGAITEPQLSERAAGYGLEPAGSYVPFRARAAPEGAIAELERNLLAAAKAAGRAGLVGTLGGDLAGLLPVRPTLDGLVATVGVGPATQLASVASGFRAATRALETAVAFGLPGVFTLDELGLKPAVVSESDVGERLTARYIKPLDELGAFGKVLCDTLRAYLRHGMRVDAAARALIVHPNTLRYRLERFEQITGADLKNTDDLLEIWWALARDELNEPPTMAAAGSEPARPRA